MNHLRSVVVNYGEMNGLSPFEQVQSLGVRGV